MRFTIDVPDDIVGGVTAAREDFNAALPEDSDDRLQTDADYLSARVIGVVQSWADQHGVSATALEKAKDALLDAVPEEKRQAVEAAIAAELSR